MITERVHQEVCEERDVLRKHLIALLEAIDPFLASQEKATDPRCGLVQPVSVQQCNELNDVFNAASKFVNQS